MRSLSRIALIVGVPCFALGIVLAQLHPLGLSDLTDGASHDSREVQISAKQGGAQTSDFEPLSAKVPSLCGYPGGHLSDGWISATPEGESQKGSGKGVYVRRHPSGQPMVAEHAPLEDIPVTAALVLGCSKGMVASADTIAAYSQSSELLAHVTLSEVTGGDREMVRSITISKGEIKASWTSSAEGDLACCGTKVATATFSLEDGRLVTADIDFETVRQPLNNLLSAVNHGNSRAANDYADVGAVETLALLRKAEGKFTIEECYGLLNSGEMPASVLEGLPLGATGDISIANSDILRFCTVVNEQGRLLVFGYARPDGEHWVLRLIAQ